MKYNKRYIKANSLAMLAAAVLGTPMMSSCSDFLEVEPQNVITLDKFWNEEGDVESTIAGCYAAMQSYGMISRMLVWGEFRSENVINNGYIEKDVNLERVLKENITASNAYTTWNEFYGIINRCNIIMKYAPKVAEADPSYTEGKLRAHIAEVTALRSLCYFYLIRTFKDVPYSEEPFLDDDQKLDLKQMSFDIVLDRIIESLESVKNDAVVRYPVTKDYYQQGRITKQTIHAMLAEMYLWKQDYSNCIRCSDLVINAWKEQLDEMYNEGGGMDLTDYSETNGYPLNPCKYSGSTDIYGYAFNQIFVSQNSDESIFELVFMNNDNMLNNGPVSNFYGAMDMSGYVKASDYVASDVKNSSPKVFKSKYDGRAYENFRFNASGDAIGINKYVASSSIMLTNPNTNSFFVAGSWGTPYPVYGKDKESRNKSNFIIYRVTDIMLLKAEALSQQMSGADGTLSESDRALRDQAFDIVNAINKRSLYQYNLKDTLVLSDYATKEAITDLVYDERNRELMFEGKRFYDLVRRSRRDGDTKYLRNKVKLKSADNASVIENTFSRMDAIYWPINLEETKVNSNLHQNPAFGSGENSSYEKTSK